MTQTYLIVIEITMVLESPNRDTAVIALISFDSFQIWQAYSFASFLGGVIRFIS